MVYLTQYCLATRPSFKTSKGTIMGIFKRISDAMHATLNDLLNHIEDPAKINEQNILDLQASKKKAQALLASSLGQKKLASAKKDECDKEIALLLTKAEAFLNNQDEEGANKIMALKISKDQESMKLAQEIKEYDHTIDIINQGMAALDSKISMLRVKTGSEALNNTSAFDTFDRMEEKVDKKEAEVLALKELLDEENKKLTLEQEIEALKRKMKK